MFSVGENVRIDGQLFRGRGQILRVQPSGGVSVRCLEDDDGENDGRRIGYTADEVRRGLVTKFGSGADTGPQPQQAEAPQRQQTTRPVIAGLAIDLVDGGATITEVATQLKRVAAELGESNLKVRRLNFADGQLSVT